MARGGPKLAYAFRPISALRACPPIVRSTGAHAAFLGRIHYTQAMIYSIKAALEVAGNDTAADNHFVLSQSVIATSVLFIIYACVIFGLCLWRALLEAEVDYYGEHVRSAHRASG
jgi:hypothetical protein